VRRRAFDRALRTTVASGALAKLRGTLVDRARMAPDGRTRTGGYTTDDGHADDAHVAQTSFDEQGKD
jgi:hypothetical protein